MASLRRHLGVFAPAPTLFLLGALLACFALGGAETAGAYELPEEARESFLSSKINDRGAGIAALASDYSDGAAAVLEALLAGNLYADRASKTFFIREGESYKPL